MFNVQPFKANQGDRTSTKLPLKHLTIDVGWTKFHFFWPQLNVESSCRRWFFKSRLYPWGIRHAHWHGTDKPYYSDYFQIPQKHLHPLHLWGRLEGSWEMLTSMPRKPIETVCAVGKKGWVGNVGTSKYCRAAALTQKAPLELVPISSYHRYWNRYVVNIATKCSLKMSNGKGRSGCRYLRANIEATKYRPSQPPLRCYCFLLLSSHLTIIPLLLLSA